MIAKTYVQIDAYTITNLLAKADFTTFNTSLRRDLLNKMNDIITADQMNNEISLLEKLWKN